jgi:hypothetical protein
MGQISDWTDGTIDRMIDIMTGKGEQWRRDGRHYRTPVSAKQSIKGSSKAVLVTGGAGYVGSHTLQTVGKERLSFL